MNIAQKRAFTKRTGSIYNNQTRRLREALGRNMSLQFSLLFFRTQVEPSIGQPCKYCGDRIGSTNFSLDHKIPLVRVSELQMLKKICDSLKLDFIEATTAVVFEWENCQIICIRCNKRKGDLTADEFESVVSLLSTFPVAAQVYIKRKLGAPLAFFKKSGPKLDATISNNPSLFDTGGKH